MTINDSEFLKQFENQTLAPTYFNHAGHLRLAWLYLNENKLEVAVNKVTNGISSYATSLGATDKFQHTFTEAIVRIMGKRLEAGQFSDLPSFLSSNKDLVEDIWAVVGQYYSKDKLNSDIAKSEYVEPDLLPID